LRHPATPRQLSNDKAAAVERSIAQRFRSNKLSGGFNVHFFPKAPG
jgi:hypothetical protein